MFQLEVTAKTLALCTLPLFAVYLISSCSHKSVLLLQTAYTPQYYYNMLMSNFQCKILESLRLTVKFRK